MVEGLHVFGAATDGPTRASDDRGAIGTPIHAPLDGHVVRLRAARLACGCACSRGTAAINHYGHVKPLFVGFVGEEVEAGGGDAEVGTRPFSGPLHSR
jgi:hypothetical protein